MTTAMCTLHVLLLWALLCPGRGNVPDVQKEIFIRPGSDLLLPIRIHLTLSHINKWRCEWFHWYFQESPRHTGREIARYVYCKLSEFRHFPNTRISENGSLIINNVTLENDGRYSAIIYNSTGGRIQTDYYTVHVEDPLTAAMCLLPVLLLGVLLCPGKGNRDQEEIFTRPGSDLLIPIRHHLILNHTDRERCDEFTWFYQKPPGSLEYIAKHRKCNMYDRRYFPNTRISENGSLIISNVTLRNDGSYSVDIRNSTGVFIQRDYYNVYVEGNVPGVQEEIFTRPGSDLLIPIRNHLNRPDRERCNRFSWFYQKPSGSWKIIAEHWYCYLSDHRYFPNTRISENGSLIISNVTLRNDGIYSVIIRESTGDTIQRDYYIIHVEVPVSVPVLRVSCPHNGSAEISCRVEVGTKPNFSLSVIGGSQGKYSTSANNITAIVESPGPWNITCTARNSVSQSEESRARVTCPEERRSGWGHFLSSGAIFVLYTGLLIFIVNDLRRMKNEKNRSERRKRRRDQVEMEMEPTYYNDCN